MYYEKETGTLYLQQTLSMRLEYGIKCMQVVYEEMKRDGAKYNLAK